MSAKHLHVNQGYHVKDLLMDLGASNQVASELSAQMQALSAIYMAYSGFPMEWELFREGREGDYRWQVYGKYNLTHITLEYSS
jgi:hypothetical protein